MVEGQATMGALAGQPTGDSVLRVVVPALTASYLAIVESLPMVVPARRTADGSLGVGAGQLAEPPVSVIWR